MEFPFRSQITEEVKSYASHTPEKTDNIFDCSLGVNPYGCVPKAGDCIRGFDKAHLQDYPHSHVMHRAICQYWKAYANLQENEITLTNSSMGALYSLNSLFIQSERREVVTFVPSFTNALVSAHQFGMDCVCVPMEMKSGKMYAKDLIKRLSNRTAYVYLDRPNNPTGQTMPLEDVEHIVTTAAQVGAYVLVDEAYGDFIPREESAVMLRNQHDNLLICRTMSKGFGLANLRAGYILSNTVIASYLEHMSHPYILGDMIRETCAVALEQPEFPIAHAEDIAEAKELVCGSIGKCIEMLESDPRVPICTLHLRKSQDFQEILLSQGILAVSGCEFELLDESYVRIRVPMLEAIATLTKALSQIDSDNF